MIFSTSFVRLYFFREIPSPNKWLSVLKQLASVISVEYWKQMWNGRHYIQMCYSANLYILCTISWVENSFVLHWRKPLHQMSNGDLHPLRCRHSLRVEASWNESLHKYTTMLLSKIQNYLTHVSVRFTSRTSTFVIGTSDLISKSAQL